MSHTAPDACSIARSRRSMSGVSIYRGGDAYHTVVRMAVALTRAFNFIRFLAESELAPQVSPATISKHNIARNPSAADVHCCDARQRHQRVDSQVYARPPEVAIYEEREGEVHHEDEDEHDVQHILHRALENANHSTPRQPPPLLYHLSSSRLSSLSSLIPLVSVCAKVANKG